MLHHVASSLLRYSSAIAGIALAIGIRLLFAPVLGTQFPFVTIFLAILATARYGGFGPALAAVIGGAGGADSAATRAASRT